MAVRGTERDWLAPEALADARPSDGSGRAVFELRPLSLGEILDRTFALYRSRFWLFAGISAVSASVQVAVQAFSLAGIHALVRSGAWSAALTAPGGPTPPLALGGLLQVQGSAYLAALVFFLIASVTQAATSLAMSQVYLGQPASARAALRAAFRHGGRWISIALWMAGSFLWLPLVMLVPGLFLLAFGARAGSAVLPVLGGVLVFTGVFAAFPVGFFFYLRNSLAIPAAVVERLGVRSTMRRSKALAKGTKGRIFVVLLITACLYAVVGVLESPASVLILLAPKQEHYLAQGFTLLISFLGRTVVAPVALIGLTLVYFDQRVRKEALDLELLLEGGQMPGSSAVAGAEGSPVHGQSDGVAGA